MYCHLIAISFGSRELRVNHVLVSSLSRPGLVQILMKIIHPLIKWYRFGRHQQTVKLKGFFSTPYET